MPVFRKSCDVPEFDKKEILRYALSGDADEATIKLVDECIAECRDVIRYDVCWSEFKVEVSESEVNLSFMKTDSKALIKNLDGCTEAVVFGATVGIDIDRLILKYGRISPSKAVIFQAIGAERIEALCNKFNDDIKEKFYKKGRYTRPRFSPGYGDFSLEAQREIFRVLDPSKNIGLSLNGSLLMSPSKSVTAIIGVSDRYEACKELCSACGKKDCRFRR